jgi:hypothetical protein
MLRRAALSLVCLCSVQARADFARGTLKVDVRDAKGAPAEAQVSATPEAGGAAVEPKRAGEVYVAEGLVDGVWSVAVAGAPPQRVEVHSRRTSGVVVVLDDQKDKKKSKKPPLKLTVSPDEISCDGETGTAIEVVVFARGVLAAGRIDVRKSGRVICAVTVAGGGATLRLPVGDYDLDAKLVGGARTGTHLRVAKGDKPPPTLLLKAR